MKLTPRRLRGAASFIFGRVAVRRRLNPAPVDPEPPPPALDELTINQQEFPFPRWALEGAAARRWVLENASRGSVGAEVGVFRGHFSEVILSTLSPKKFYMIDPWTKIGEFFP